MSNAEKMWHVWLNSPQGQMLAAVHSAGTLVSMKYTFIIGFEMAHSDPDSAPERAREEGADG